MWDKNYLFVDLIIKNRLLSLDPVRKRENVLELTDSPAIYNCLDWFSDEDITVDYLLISNPQRKVHLVLLDNRVPLVYVGYDQYEWSVSIKPIECGKSGQHTELMLMHHFMLFVRSRVLEMDIPENPEN